MMLTIAQYAPNDPATGEPHTHWHRHDPMQAQASALSRSASSSRATRMPQTFVANSLGVCPYFRSENDDPGLNAISVQSPITRRSLNVRVLSRSATLLAGEAGERAGENIHQGGGRQTT